MNFHCFALTQRRAFARSAVAVFMIFCGSHLARAQIAAPIWAGHGKNAQHTGLSSVRAQPLKTIHWQTPVDTDPQYSGSDLLIHYGSPLVTPNNTVIFPVKTGTASGFEVQARRTSDGALIWRNRSDYRLPPVYDWTPSVGPALTSNGFIAIPRKGGNVYVRNNLDKPIPVRALLVAFYGNDHYRAARKIYDSTVFINTPITTDIRGGGYFGFYVAGDTPLHLQSGIAHIDRNGHGTWVSASAAAGASWIQKVQHNCAPAISNDGKTVYVAVNSSAGYSGAGYLLALDSQTLKTKAAVLLTDPQSGWAANIEDDGTATPMVGPDGDVYFGILEQPWYSNHDRGWLLHFSGDLSQVKTPGAFGWDDTPSVVPAALIPAYKGTSTYLLMCKYNNYAGIGGDGINKIAILDPNAQQSDPFNGTTEMQEVQTIAGVTPDPNARSTFPDAVKEWCINDAAVDTVNKAVYAGSEDGVLYHWDLPSNTFTESVVLTPGIGEAYTPTVIAPDGTVFAINNATLFAVGK